MEGEECRLREIGREMVGSVNDIMIDDRVVTTISNGHGSIGICAWKEAMVSAEDP